ncbi:MAG: site-specific integrase [Methylococcales bacterium]|nr:site-specific integrase [Methylococcales bacterium]
MNGMKTLTAQKNSQLIAASEQAEKARQYHEAAQGAFAENTERARRADWAIFEAWCDNQQQNTLPTSIDTLVAFIDAQSEIKKVATVKRYLTTIATAHKAAGLENPVKDEFVRLAVRRMARKNGTRQKQAQGFNWPQIYLALQTLEESPRSLLDKALICVSYDTLCRRSETVAIQLEDITFTGDGSATVLIKKSKTDQTGEGSVKYLSPTSVDYLKAWLEFSNITEGFVFRGLNRWQQLLSGPLSGEGVSRSFKRVARQTGLDIEQISGHSTRVGACQDLVAAGIDMPAVMQAGGWTTPERVARYSEQLQTKRGGMAQLSAIQRR